MPTCARQFNEYGSEVRSACSIYQPNTTLLDKGESINLRVQQFLVPFTTPAVSITCAPTETLEASPQTSNATVVSCRFSNTSSWSPMSVMIY
ncbi:hypothetical protein EGR_00355 [Echinococcus granulosus]|uniref:Uncharacterized protein n=1 Tax=Echinococcus granulosus TaxID=6210 RepID=W6UWQ3_ECHGR|nr:hypothetical protein EGR_00355 [Echinococcus granulosus]EUB65086.1 hypothetical protein EGR_00355 [Echinococcus granulosus]